MVIQCPVSPFLQICSLETFSNYVDKKCNPGSIMFLSEDFQTLAQSSGKKTKLSSKKVDSGSTVSAAQSDIIWQCTALASQSGLVA